ncbi:MULTISPECIES: hypothetical protein [Paraburkholderia]|uniref:Uncharacterized protein n=1 Tax=Paraburkholderia youngii TaxID=2782701 RepID=A0ABX2NRG2_9BURK|nr:hypothetical protein [Paraburkholderia youngii]NUX52622.1 hypothetical protein [Paraburkholderia youngii]NVI06790.1 hypothetical protein [Paraburkholderia youngii]
MIPSNDGTVLTKIPRRHYRLLTTFGHIHTNNAPVATIFLKEMVWTRRDDQDRTVDRSLIFIERIMMSMYARDLLELRRDDPASIELRKMAMNIIAAGTRDQREGC